jgi:hypothetical protein
MRQIIRLYRFFNILSIDVVAGAVISALFFAKIFQVQIRAYGLIALGLTVWGIYTLDHLRDAKKIKHAASTSRHRFHQRHFRSLTILLCAIGVMDLGSIIFIKKQVFEWGLLLGLFVGLYLLIQHYLRFLKEFFIALLYTGGVLLLALSTKSVELTSIQYLIIVQFILIAWINLIMFSWFDQAYDQQDKQNSFVTILGGGPTKIVLYVLMFLNFGLSLLGLLLWGINFPMIILIAMNATLFLVFQFRKSLSKNDRYRLIGDAVFLFPALYLT